MDFVLLVNPDRCTSCGNCVYACESEHGTSRINFEDKIPEFCMHCNPNEAMCYIRCPEEAFINKDGILLIDEEKCILCERCIISCPVNVVKVDKEKETAVKCTLCLDSEKIVPVCVEACRDGALRMAPKEEIKKHHEKLKELAESWE
jgi:Fe-S-cluster-containing hydrogenase component 2